MALLPDVDDVLVAEREAMRDLGGTDEEIHVESPAHGAEPTRPASGVPDA